jgi:hypothetical protein
MKSEKSNQERKKQNPSISSSANYKIIPTDIFISEAKRLARKYPRIKEDFFELQKSLKKDPITGNDALGKDCYKVRMSITDKSAGRSGGARVIIEVKVIKKKVYVLSVYDKSEIGNLFDKELQEILKKRLAQFPNDK